MTSHNFGKWTILENILLVLNGNVYAEDDEVTHGQVSPVERMDDKGLIPKVDDTGNL